MNKTLPQIIYDPLNLRPKTKRPPRKQNPRDLSLDLKLSEVRSRSKDILIQEQELTNIYHLQHEIKATRYERNKNRYLVSKLKVIERRADQWQNTRQHHMEYYILIDIRQSLMEIRNSYLKQLNVASVSISPPNRLKSHVPHTNEKEHFSDGYTERSNQVTKKLYTTRVEKLHRAQEIWEKEQAASIRNIYKRRPYYAINELKTKLNYDYAVEMRFDRLAKESVLDQLL